MRNRLWEVLLAATCLVVILLSAVLAQTPVSLAREYRKNHETEIIDEFRSLLSIPNVATDTANIRKNAAKLIGMMQRRGIKSHLLEGDGPPAVFGELSTPGA